MAALTARLGVPTPVNAAIVETVHAIEQGRRSPAPRLLDSLASAGDG